MPQIDTMSQPEVRPLPVGKKYHVFLYHVESDEDMIFANSLAAKLSKHGFACYSITKNFHPGRTSIGNIVNAIDLSVKMVIIYSKTFFQNFESSFACEMYMQHCMILKRFLLIPIRFDDCTIPWLYEALPSIDARPSQSEDTWFQQLIRSVQQTNDVSNFFLAGPGISLILKHVCQYRMVSIKNMKVLARRRGVYSSGEAKRLKMHYTIMLQLHNEGVILAQRKFDTMMADIDYMFRDYCRVHKFFFPVLAYFFILAVAGSVILITVRYFSRNLLERWLPLFLVFFTAFCFSVIISWLIKYRWKDFYHKAYKKYLQIINEKLFEDHILVTVVEEIIYIVYYDYEACKKYIKENKDLFSTERTTGKMLSKWRELVYGDIPLDKSLEERLLIKEAGMYACWHIQGKLDNPKENRHEEGPEPCLCQYIEQKYNIHTV